MPSPISDRAEVPRLEPPALSPEQRTFALKLLTRRERHLRAAALTDQGLPVARVAADLGLTDEDAAVVVRRAVQCRDAYARTPLVVMQERAVGRIDQAAMLGELLAWPYSASVVHDWWMGELSEALTASDAGDLVHGLIEGWLSRPEYDFLLERITVPDTVYPPREG